MVVLIAFLYVCSFLKKCMLICSLVCLYVVFCVCIFSPALVEVCGYEYAKALGHSLALELFPLGHDRARGPPSHVEKQHSWEAF